MLDDVLKVKDVVERILKEDQKARDDDKWLILKVLRDMGFRVYINYNEMESMPSWESITRCRRKFQENGDYPASEECTRLRKIEQTKMNDINKTWDEDTSDSDINRL